MNNERQRNTKHSIIQYIAEEPGVVPSTAKLTEQELMLLQWHGIY
jgi:hypothetical protein